jgi:DNA primase
MSLVAQKASERVGGVSVQLSHLDKTFFPDDGISKGDLIGYYRDMARASCRTCGTGRWS